MWCRHYTANDLDFKTSIRSKLGYITLYAVSESSSVVSNDVLSESLLPTNCDYGRQFDPCAVWDAVPEPPSATRQLSEPLDLCSSLLIISRRSPELHIYAPLETFCPSYSKSLSTVVSTHCFSCHLNKNRLRCKQHQMRT